MNKSSSASAVQPQASQAVLPSEFPERLVTFEEVQSRTGFRKSFIYSQIQKGEFPAPVKIGSSSRWKDSEISDWVSKRIQDSESAKNARV